MNWSFWIISTLWSEIQGKNVLAEMKISISHNMWTIIRTILGQCSFLDLQTRSDKSLSRYRLLEWRNTITQKWIPRTYHFVLLFKSFRIQIMFITAHLIQYQCTQIFSKVDNTSTITSKVKFEDHNIKRCSI